MVCYTALHTTDNTTPAPVLFAKMKIFPKQYKSPLIPLRLRSMITTENAWSIIIIIIKYRRAKGRVVQYICNLMSALC